MTEISKVSFTLFGREFSLISGGETFLEQDSLWRAKTRYERFLSTQSLPNTGVAIDIGAGFGAFTIPFAVCNPDWTIWAFEPEVTAYQALRQNVADLNLSNVVIVNAAVGNSDNTNLHSLEDAIKSKNIVALLKNASQMQFSQKVNKPNFIVPLRSRKIKSDETLVNFTTIPAKALVAIKADLLKIVAPDCETAILDDILAAPIPYIFGEIWSLFPTEPLYRFPTSSQRVFLPVAGRDLALRRSEDLLGLTPGLDVVVAMYNSEQYIIECVQSLINNTQNEVRVIVVDDGSTDGGASLVEKTFGNNPRVKLVQKLNGGCASARNFGRLHSTATHIAFVDADDYVDPNFFPVLLELARYSNGEVVQGGYSTVEEVDGATLVKFGTDREKYKNVARSKFRNMEYYTVNPEALMLDQPTIWRRVYRRDFLDSKDIWFPEHIRAFDDQIFQLLCLQYTGKVVCIDHVDYYYRQHMGQDIQQNDERGFYSLEMFRLILKRSVREGWNNFTPILNSYINTVIWVHSGLKDELQETFLKAAAELWVYMCKSNSQEAFDGVNDERFPKPFLQYVAPLMRQLEDLDDGYIWAYLDAKNMHKNMLQL